MPASLEQLLTVAEVADKLRLSLASVYLLVNSGDLPAIRVGHGRGTLRVNPDEVQAYLERKQVRVVRVRNAMRKVSTAKYDFKHLKVGSPNR